MMGYQVAHAERCELINLEEFVPQDHLLRAIDRYLDLTHFRQHVAASYSHRGRPSVDPELMIRMLIIGYCYGIRSERRLCEEVHLNLAYRWFCRLGLKDKVPDHSTFSKNRHGRFRECDAFRELFESVLRRCMAEGLVGGEGFATDASVVKADARRQHAVSGQKHIDWSDHDLLSRPIKEYLAALEAANPPATPPASISLTDPCASWTAACGPAMFAYATNYLVDIRAGVIVDVEPSPVNHVAEVSAAQRMIDRVKQLFALTPQRLIGDTAYGTAAMLHWLWDERAIAPHVPVWDKAERTDGTFGRSAFTYDAGNNQYICPAGKFLKPSWRMKKKNPYRYRASLYDCQACALKAQCCPGMDHRQIDRSPFEQARDVARQIAQTDAYRQSRKDRKKVEMLFAHMKRIMHMGQLRLRGWTGAHDEFLLTATVQNLRKMAKTLCPLPSDAPRQAS